MNDDLVKKLCRQIAVEWLNDKSPLLTRALAVAGDELGQVVAEKCRKTFKELATSTGPTKPHKDLLEIHRIAMDGLVGSNDMAATVWVKLERAVEALELIRRKAVTNEQ